MTDDAKRLLDGIKPKLNGKAKEFARADFWHYTTLENAHNIAFGDTPGFFASRIDIMNDIDEAKLHGEESKRVFCLCFCNTGKEKIPMWYMYSGKKGRGVSLGITPSRMRDFINSIDTVYPVNNNRPSKKAKLVRGIDFELEAGWIAYRNQKEANNYHFKGKWYDKIDAEFKKGNYFIKLYPWYYEDEFRLVFKFKSTTQFEKIFIPLNNMKYKLLIGPGYYDKSTGIYVEPQIDKAQYLKCEKSGLRIDMK